MMDHIAFKTAQAVSDPIIAMLEPFAHIVHTLTTHNSNEFSEHERIALALNADFYFANPYASWEPGTNEKMIGLIRQFFPKKMRFDCITAQDIQLALHQLNHRQKNVCDLKPFLKFYETITVSSTSGCASSLKPPLMKKTQTTHFEFS
jgi:IS30 family transposase